MLRNMRSLFPRSKGEIEVSAGRKRNKKKGRVAFLATKLLLHKLRAVVLSHQSSLT